MYRQRQHGITTLNIQRSRTYKVPEKGHPRQIKSALKLIRDAKKPLAIIGGGITISDSMDLANQFLDNTNIPGINTLMGHGLNPKNEDLFLGPTGMHGAEVSNYAVQRCDLLIALGVRFSDRILGNIKTFAPKAKVIHVDIDPAEIGKTVAIDVPIVGDLSLVMKELVNAEVSNDHADWVAELKQYKKDHPFHYNEDGTLKQQYLLELSNKIFPEDTIVTTDVGQHQMWATQYYRFRRPRTLITSGGLGTMGFGLPAAIGAKIACRDREVLMISGDGGFQMNIQELATIKRYGLNVKMIVMDNFSLGMVRQWQVLMFEKRYAATPLPCNPDFAKVADAYGIRSRTVSKKEDAEDAITELFKSEKSMLLHALVDREDIVLPWVPAGTSLDDIITKMDK